MQSSGVRLGIYPKSPGGGGEAFLDAGVVSVDDEPEGEFLSDAIAVAAYPPAAGDRAVPDLHRHAIELWAPMRVAAAQVLQDTVDYASRLKVVTRLLGANKVMPSR